MIDGKLLRRTKLNLNRLLDPIYTNPRVFDYCPDWPGDFPGRALLSFTSLYQAFEGCDEERNVLKYKIQAIVSHLEEHINKDKFFGPVFNKDYIYEQQLSGNAWYIRGLCKYYDIFKDDKVIEYLHLISENFLIPLSKQYASYPIHERLFDGGVCGREAESKDGNWLLSSDVGCAYILLDGFVSCYEIIKTPQLKSAIELAINEYSKIDFVSLKCQTHATMTCARAILRFYLITKEEKYLNLVIDIFNKYVKYGMTDDYQNVNWFRKENSWTEPCCVVDSFILAKQLYLITNDVLYLKLYNRIYLNGLRTFQRINGGAGCSTVVKDDQRVLKQWMFEAFFCCTMRTSEGLYELSKSLLRQNDEYVLLISQSFKNDDIEIHIDLYDEKVFEITFHRPVTISIYVPDGFESDYKVTNNFIKVSGEKEQTVSIKFELAINKSRQTYLLGDMVLSQKNKHISTIYYINKYQYSLIYDSSILTEETIKDIEQKL